MLVVSSSVRVAVKYKSRRGSDEGKVKENEQSNHALDGVHSNTTSTGPRVALGLELEVSA